MLEDKKPQPQPRTSWVLTPSAFALLLKWLDADEALAGETHERLRRKLLIFFEHRGCQHPEELTDKTLDRIARKLAAGEEIQVADPAAYCYGIAHNLLKEYWRDPARAIVALDSSPLNSHLSTHAAAVHSSTDEFEQTEIDLDHLSICLKKLPPADRELILLYYQGEHRDRINNRQELAQRLGVSPGSLRIRALRIREQLHDCINRCQKRGTGQ